MNHPDEDGRNDAPAQRANEDSHALPQRHFANLEASQRDRGNGERSEPGPPPPEAEQLGAQAARQANGEEGAGGAPGEPPSLYDQVVGACRSVYDPEIPVNIYDLGLIYTIDVRDDQSVHVQMTLTSPACPVAGTLPPEVEDRIREVEGITGATVEVVWDPPWHPGMMAEDAALELGFM